MRFSLAARDAQPPDAAGKILRHTRICDRYFFERNRHELVKKGELTVEQGKVLNEELKHNIKDAIRDNVTLHIVTDEDDEEKPEDGGDESEAAPQGDLMDAVDSMDDEQLTALKARIQAAEAARAEKNETPKESSSDENTEG